MQQLHCLNCKAKEWKFSLVNIQEDAMVRMRLIIIHLILTIGFNAICFAHDYGARSDFIEGDGIIFSDIRQLPFFKEIDIRGTYRFTIESGKKQTLTIKGDQNILPHITTIVKDRKLFVSNNKSFRTKTPLHLHITVPDIIKVTSNGSSEISINGIRNRTFAVVLTGAGKMSVSGTTKKFVVRLFGSSALNAKDFQSEDVEISTAGANTARVFADKVLDACIKGVGSVVYYGCPSEINKNIAGVGRLIKHD
jgi:hypothetical protein